MIKRIIFDQDNTLIKWTEENWNTLDETFNELNYPLIYEKKKMIIKLIDEYENTYNQYKIEYMYEYINKNLNEELPIKWIDIWIKKLSNRKIELEPYVKETLEYLKNKYELVVLTNWFSLSQINTLKKANIYQYINEFVSTDEVLNKPNKEAFLKAIGNRKKEECIMIGDTFNTDIIGAYEFGIEAIWYNPNHKQLKQKIKVIEIDNLKQLTKYL